MTTRCMSKTFVTCTKHKEWLGEEDEEKQEHAVAKCKHSATAKTELRREHASKIEDRSKDQMIA